MGQSIEFEGKQIDLSGINVKKENLGDYLGYTNAVTIDATSIQDFLKKVLQYLNSNFSNEILTMAHFYFRLNGSTNDLYVAIGNKRQCCITNMYSAYLARKIGTAMNAKKINLEDFPLD